MDAGRKKRKLSDGSPAAVVAQQEAHSDESADASNDQRRSLFVRSLPASVTSEKLATHFSDVYPIKHAVVVVDKTTNISRGFGFVTFADAQDAQDAAKRLNNSVLDGRKINVEVAEARHRDDGDGVVKGQNATAAGLRAQREQQKHSAQAPKLIVRNLPWSIKAPEDLAKLFLSYGKVKHAVVPKRGPNSLYGFGIVILRGQKNAEKALAGVNGKQVDGRTLAVDWAVDKDTWQQSQEKKLTNPAMDSTARSADSPDLDTSAGENGASTDASSDDLPGDLENGVDSTGSEASILDVAGTEEKDETLDSDHNGEDDRSLRSSENNSTIFIRNLPYDCTDEDLLDHFTQFGPVRYARVVYDPTTERPRGTAFVCFYDESAAKHCVKSAPHKASSDHENQGKADKKRKGESLPQSILQNTAEDPSGKYTLGGRVLQVARALPKEDADRRAAESSNKRVKRAENDRRRLYLLSEGTVDRGSALYASLGKAELDIREASAKQRQKLIKSNPNLGLSLTRLSVRNIPRHVDSKLLKELARKAVVGFAEDVKAGNRQPLTRVELSRASEEMREAEHRRKERGVGLVKQAKIVFEGQGGTKVKEGTGRSRGYGFVEYHTHRAALAGLRWLNGHLVKPKEGTGEKPKRLIVEFAIENAQVVMRRAERERVDKERGKIKATGEDPVDDSKDYEKTSDRFGRGGFNNRKTAIEKRGRGVGNDRGRGNDRDTNASHKRKRNNSDAVREKKKPKVEAEKMDQDAKNQLAKRNRIISKKRAMRKNRKG